MRAMISALVTLATLVWAAPLQADPWRDESGHGRRGHVWKEEYRSGNCKVERKWTPGDYKEEIKCDGPPWGRGSLSPAAIDHFEPMPPPAALPPLPSGPLYGDTFRDDLGRYCREYQTTGTIDGRRESLYGTACLQPDGSWAFND